MLTELQKKELESQQYRVVGSHSAVKICAWTKKMIRGEGGCYTFRFYGVRSSQGMQMTTSMSCANRCLFCWRDYKSPVSKEWKWAVDDPKSILEGCLASNKKLLEGFGGFDRCDRKAFSESQDIKHVAISLSGEPLAYPKINEFIEECDKKGISTFLVTKGQYPENIKNLKQVTQLYLSVDAPNKALLKEIDVPLFADYWERLNKSLKYLSQKKGRTCIRLTMVKGRNMVEPENYAKLITKADPDFVEVKAYMFVGASMQRLEMSNMPFHEDVVLFAKELAKSLPEYEIVSEHIPSRVVMLAKKSFKKGGKWFTWIDFEKLNKLKASGKEGKEFPAEDFMKETPQTGISGKGTLKK
jgi:tRNA wybutosine-synthesizing protein 1